MVEVHVIFKSGAKKPEDNFEDILQEFEPKSEIWVDSTGNRCHADLSIENFKALRERYEGTLNVYLSR